MDRHSPRPLGRDNSRLTIGANILAERTEIFQGICQRRTLQAFDLAGLYHCQTVPRFRQWGLWWYAGYLREPLAALIPIWRIEPAWGIDSATAPPTFPQTYLAPYQQP